MIMLRMLSAAAALFIAAGCSSTNSHGDVNWGSTSGATSSASSTPTTSNDGGRSVTSTAMGGTVFAQSGGTSNATVTTVVPSSGGNGQLASGAGAGSTIQPSGGFGAGTTQVGGFAGTRNAIQPNGGAGTATYNSAGGANPAPTGGTPSHAGAQNSVNGGGTVTATAGVAGVVGTSNAGSCAGYQPAALQPLYLVFVVDKSGSMGNSSDGSVNNATTRWQPLKTGMTNFFLQSIAPNVMASIKYFPAPGDKATTCNADYRTATMTPLSTPQPLIDTLNNAAPSGGTPTLSAVMGGIASAKALMSAKPGSTAIVVLITDGEPGIYNPNTAMVEYDCAPAGSTLTNTIEDIATVVNAANRQVPRIGTYVIGIGEATNAMSAIATAGGTEYVYLDSSQSPDATSAKLAATLSNIRSQSLPCNMPIPDATAFSPSQFNIGFRHSNGIVEEFAKSPNCAKAGWYFDNESAPTQAHLCPTTCSALKSDTGGSLQVQLGCPTRVN